LLGPLLVNLAAPCLAAGDGVTLSVTGGVSPSEVRLDWVGAQPPYTVFRGTVAATVTDPGNALGQTSGTIWIDVPPAGTIHYYVIAGTCLPSTEVCDGADNDCDGYTDEGCGTVCVIDTNCAPEEYCSSGGVCLPDVGDGGACGDAAECLSSHCQNGFCCASGDCCGVAADCPRAYSQPPACDSAATCQGSRADAICTASQCGASVVGDDSACSSGVQSQDCGPYPAVFCTGQATQPGNQSSLCATSCAVDAACDPAAHCDASTCVPDLGNGAACDEASDCITSQCVDAVCCDFTCGGTCQACGLSGSVGTCTKINDGADPDGECGGVSCLGYYWGWSGDSCIRRADVGAAAATCGGDAACRTAGEECPGSGPGSVALTCNSTCQNPNLTTCTATTPGVCTNVNPGNQTCGAGICQVTVPQCVNGAPNTCVPGLPSTETCNNLDDNCDDIVDNGAFSDAFELNDDCSTVRTLPTVGSNQLVTQNGLTVYPVGDDDFFRINATESDASCSCCDGLCLDEDFQLAITLTVPAGAGSYMFCTGTTCASQPSCQEVVAGTSETWTYTLDGACPGVDSYARYVHIYGDSPPAFECSPYTLSYRLTPGCF